MYNITEKKILLYVKLKYCNIIPNSYYLLYLLYILTFQTVVGLVDVIQTSTSLLLVIGQFKSART